MGKRSDLKTAIIQILTDMNLFFEVYEEPNDIEKIMSFPVAWVNLNSEIIRDGAISTTCYMREIGLEITIGTKHLTTDRNMDEMIDTVFDQLKDEYTLNGTAINLTPIDVRTDQGYFHPFAIASLNFIVTTR